jgi:hypothetical protein
MEWYVCPRRREFEFFLILSVGGASHCHTRTLSQYSGEYGSNSYTLRDLVYRYVNILSV